MLPVVIHDHRHVDPAFFDHPPIVGVRKWHELVRAPEQAASRRVAVQTLHKRRGNIVFV